MQNLEGGAPLRTTQNRGEVLTRTVAATGPAGRTAIASRVEGLGTEPAGGRFAESNARERISLECRKEGSIR